MPLLAAVGQAQIVRTSDNGVKLGPCAFLKPKSRYPRLLKNTANSHWPRIQDSCADNVIAWILLLTTSDHSDFLATFRTVCCHDEGSDSLPR